jgi:hypothetical protein
MEIKASSVYDKKTIIAFTKQSLRKKQPLIVICFILLGFVDTVGLYGVLTSNYPMPSFVFCLAATVFFVLYVYIFLPRMTYNLHKTATDAVNEYVFYDTKLTATSTSQGISGTHEVNYTALQRVYETKEYLFLYIAKAKAMIIDKSTIENNGIEQIRAAITSQIGANKYKINI